MRDVGIAICVPLLSVSLALAVIELTARAIWPRHNSVDICMRPDPRTIYSHVPNCRYTSHVPESETVEYSYDECGQRNVISCLHVENASPRIAFIGDSFTEGMAVPVEHGFVWHTRQELHRRGLKAAVLNFGVSGYDLLQYHEILVSALAFKPRLIVVGLLPNDLFESPSFKSLHRMHDRLKDLGPGSLMTERQRAWRTEGFLAVVRHFLSHSTAASLFQHYMFASDTIYLSTYLVRGRAADFLQRTYSAEWEGNISGAADLLNSMQDNAAREGARLIIVLIPQRIQASMISYTGLPQSLDPDGLAKHLRPAIGDHMNLFNFLDTLRAHPKPSSVYFPADGHLTKEGNELLGAALAEYMLSSGLLN